jgi:hypothetical protein
MKLPLLALFAFLLLPLTGEAQQQIYKTTDEKGNTVFTDSPPTEEAKPVQLGSPNIADSVEVRPHQLTPTAQVRPSVTEESPQDMPMSIGGNDDPRDDVYEAHRKRELRERATDGEHTPEHLPATKPRPAVRPAGGARR